MSLGTEFVGFILPNKVAIVFDEDPKKSIYFPDDELEKVSEAIKLLTDVKFEVREND